MDSHRNFTDANKINLIYSEFIGIASIILTLIIMRWGNSIPTSIFSDILIAIISVVVISCGLLAFANGQYLHFDISKWGIFIRHGAFGLWRNNIATNDIISVNVTLIDNVKDKITKIQKIELLHKKKNKDKVGGFILPYLSKVIVITTKNGTFFYASKFVEEAADSLREIYADNISNTH
ncbi:MAG: hypothetical protein NTY09_14980 [bacterium]|nr:hypothetical protein [bacterium]